MTKYYHCPSCGVVSQGWEWNEATEMDFGSGIELIEISKEKASSGCEFTCPKCDHTSFVNNITYVHSTNDIINHKMGSFEL